MATYITVSPDLEGSVYSTNFQLSANIPSTFKKTAWSLGDGAFVYNTTHVEKFYNYPGFYNVSLSAWTDNGLFLEDEVDLKVDYIYRDSVILEQIPSEYGTPGKYSIEPFVVSLTSAKINEPICLVFQAYNTRSIPHYAVPEKWQSIVPRWRFVDAETNEIINGSIVLKTEYLYRDSIPVAVSATKSFYYVDDLSTGTNLNTVCPLLLSMTLSTQNFVYPPESLIYPYYSYSNSEVARAVIAWQVNDIIPTALKVSENYINEIYPFKWTNVPIPVTVTCRFDPSAISTFDNALALSEADVFSYPRTNELGSAFPLNVYLLSGNQTPIPSSYYRINNSEELYFQSVDRFNNDISGYVYTTITPLSPINTTVYVGASTVATNQGEDANSFSFPDGFPVYPFVYVSHPFENTINKINIVTYPSYCENINHYKNLGVLVEGTASFVEVPAASSTDLINYKLSGTSAIYGLTFDPITNILYAADADQDILYSFAQGKTLLSSVQLSAITENDYNSPSYISTDKQHNIWVSLYNNQRVLKFSSNLQFLLSAVPTVSIPLSTTNNNSIVLSGIGEQIIAPPVVETDKDNNIWVSYGHVLSSMVVKFDSNGTQLFSVTGLEVSSVPVALGIDVTNNVWVANYNTNNLQYYSSTGTLLSTLSTGFIHPSYLALDRDNNVWFTHGHNFCGVLNTTTGEVSSWKFQTTAAVEEFSVPQTVTYQSFYGEDDVQLAYFENEIWGGLAVDVYNRVWVIDSDTNTVYVFNPNEPLRARSFVVQPKADKNYIYKTGDSFVSDVQATYVRSAQAAGDWTGNKWYQKYSGAFNTLPVSGISAGFGIYDVNESFKIAKKNEEFDYADYLQSLALPEILKNNTELFDGFLKAVAGDSNITEESIGRVIYERVANFVQTHSDLETAEIDQLMSFAEQLSVQAKTYGTDFPNEVKRLINLFSIPKHLLRGVKEYSSDIRDNVGNKINFNQVVTAGEYIIAQDRQFGKYQLVYLTPLIDNTTSDVLSSYSLSSLEINGLRSPLLENYEVFEYVPLEIGYTNNIINWDSDQTTVDYSLSSYEDWYGNNGLVEVMFNNLLSRKLFTEN